MMSGKWEVVLSVVVCTVVGIGCGFIIAGGFAEPAVEDDEPADDSKLSAATLENLGVRVGSLQPTTFFRSVSVAAIVEETPMTEQPVYAPIGGRVESVEVERGTIVAPGGVVVTLVRDPLPRPKLTFTAEILRPAQENVHETVLEFRTSGAELRIAKAEFERIEGYSSVDGDELPVIPRQRVIDLRYQLSRAERTYHHARLELAKHGLSERQIDALEEGHSLPQFDETMWQRALARNGLWPEQAEKLAAVLPAELRKLPWATATVAELCAGGLVTEKLIEWMSSPEVSRHFLEFGVLLQRGHTLEDLQRLHGLNALQPIVKVVAPPMGDAGQWDVHEILVRPGARVSSGDKLLALHDNRMLLLRTEPVGGEVASILHAAAQGHDVVAKPLIPGSGPVLEGIKIRHVESSVDNEGTVAFSEVENTVHSEIETQGAVCRTWSLREGLRYTLEVPSEKLEKVFVLPAAAITEEGPDTVVFLEDGDGFRSVPVVLAHRDHEVAVIKPSRQVKLFPGDRIVMSGAFELGLALKRGDAPVGHGHSHGAGGHSH